MVLKIKDKKGEYINMKKERKLNLKNLKGLVMCGVVLGSIVVSTHQGSAQEVNMITEKALTNFNVGQGIKWPEQVFAPFVDMTAYVSDGELGNSGAPNLKELALQSGTKYFNLGFMQAQSVDSDRINWSWGGFSGLNEKDNDGWQYEGIKKSIRELREIGGDVVVSFGGLNTGALWEVSSDEAKLINAYTEIIEGYGLTRIDFDIEGGIQGYEHNRLNAKAVKKVQDATGVEVTLTLPVMDFGLTQDGLGTLQAYLDAGVDLSIVNIMTMCYGPSVIDYAQGSIDAVENTKNQVQSYYKQYASMDLTDSEAYKKIGTTTSIGFENEAHPYFSGEMMTKVVEHAIEKNIGQVSFWSINRDAKIDNGVGKVNDKFEFSTISNKFTVEATDNELPSQPANVKAIQVSADSVELKWDPATSTQAIKEYNVYRDGKKIDSVNDTNYLDTGLIENTNYVYTIEAVDIDGKVSAMSQKIYVITTKSPESELPEKPTGLQVKSVDENTIGITWSASQINNKVMYYVVFRDDKQIAMIESNSFTDKGLNASTEYTYKIQAVDTDGNKSEVSNELKVTTKSSPVNPELEGTFNLSTIYVGGEIVSYNGLEYQAKWWTQGELPDVSNVWELITKDVLLEWNPTKAYNGGDCVLYKGTTYQAKWWTQNNIPSISSDVWTAIK